jgi:quinate dehydrogenase (quinone)
MWGATPLDQLVCRIEFRNARYEGDFTPPGTTPALEYPSWLGGANWGSISVVENLGYMIVNDTRVPVTNQLILARDILKMGFLLDLFELHVTKS